MNMQEIKELIQLFDQSTLMELKIEQDATTILFSKRSEYPQVLSISSLENTKDLNKVENLAKEVEQVEMDTVEDCHRDLEMITSPIVGIVYLKPLPDADPFIKKGQNIETNQVVCIVEAMKIMNEIKSSISGQLMEIYVEDGQMVDFGQPLFGIKISDR